MATMDPHHPQHHQQQQPGQPHQPQSIAIRRQVAVPSMTQFTLPPPSSDIPSMRNPSYPSPALSNAGENTRREFPPLTSAGARGAPPSSLPLPVAPMSPFNSTSAASSSILTPPTSGGMPDAIGSSPPGAGGNNAQSPGGHPFYPHGTWPTPGNSQQQPGYSYSSSTNQTSYANRQYGNGLASPPMNQYPHRSSPTAPNSDTLPNHAPYQDQQQSFPSPASGGSNGSGGGGGGGAGPSILASSSLGTQPQVNGASQPSSLAQPMMNGQAPPGQHQPSPIQGHHGPPSQVPEGGYRQPPTPTGYYSPVSASQPPPFSPYTSQPPHTSSAVPSPTTSAPPLHRGLGTMSRMHPPPYNGQPSHHIPGMAYPGYPPMSSPGGAVLSNLHQPGGGLTMITNGYPAAMQGYGQPMYLNHHAPHASQQDRPFKCDQCPQSFNRNHDLKRHKRIHLAVKPFPCLYCDKSFSRKDALKRHKLVKGCGDGEKAENTDASRIRNGNNSETPPGDESAPHHGAN